MLQLSQVYESLKYVHFNESEVKVYLALLKKKVCSPAEVVRLSGLNRTMVYDLLKSLEAKGGCTLLNRGKRLYEAVNPEILLKKGQVELEYELELCKEKARHISNDLMLLYKNAIEPDAKLDYITVLKDPVQIADKISKLASTAKNEILNFSVNSTLVKGLKEIRKKDERAIAELIKRSKASTLESLTQRGVVIRSITGLEQLSVNLITETLERCMALDNVDLRIVKRVPCMAKIYDQRNILLNIGSMTINGYQPLILHLQNEGFAEILRDSFYQRFNNAPSVKDLDIDILLKERRIVQLKSTRQNH